MIAVCPTCRGRCERPRPFDPRLAELTILAADRRCPGCDGELPDPHVYWFLACPADSSPVHVAPQGGPPLCGAPLPGSHDACHREQRPAPGPACPECVGLLLARGLIPGVARLLWLTDLAQSGEPPAHPGWAPDLDPPYPNRKKD